MTDATSTAPERIWRRDYAVPTHLIETTELTFELDPERTVVRSKLTMRRHPQSAAGTPLTLHGENLETLSVHVDGEERTDDLRAADAKGRLTLEGLPEQFTLEAVVAINPMANKALEGLYISRGIFCTQCEAEGFRRITWYLDRPDVMARFKTTLIAAESMAPVLLSNGNRVGEETLPDGRRKVTWVDPFKKPSYLFALVAGDLKAHRGQFKTMSGRDVALEIWVEEKDLDRCQHALESLQHSMRWDEETFGLEYDLDLYMIVAVSDFNMGAMENKGLNVFNTKYVLAKPETATDDDYEHIEAVIAHEYFHNWTGNRVTCRDWFQLTLKEGLTVYRDQSFTADRTSEAVKRIGDVRALRIAQFTEDAGPMSHPVRPESYIEMNNFYTSTVYEKGAEVVRMYATLLGKEGFRKGMDLYFARHDGQAVTCDDFRAAMADANGVNLDQFGRWYAQRGTPAVTVTEAWDEQSKVLSLTFVQDNPMVDDGDPLHIPVRMALIGADGSMVPLRAPAFENDPTEAVLELKQKQETHAFACPSGRPMPSLFRGFSAPIRLNLDRSPQALAFALAHETDPFNRWDAGQEYMTEVLLDQEAGLRAGETRPIPAEFVAAVERVLLDDRLDGAMKALALALPSERILHQRVDEIHADTIHRARSGLRRYLAEQLKARWQEVYEATRPRVPYSIERSEVERRSLNGLCLGYLAGLPENSIDQELGARFDAADNMTDSQAAVGLLADRGGAEAERVLEAFYQRFEGDDLVIDKWFQLQALSSHAGTMDRIEALKAHRAFNIENPNRTRSLIGVFAMANPGVFHDPSGRGYRLLEEVILELSGKNPQMGARLAAAFNGWRRHEPKRRDLQQASLERILAKEDLAKDIREIVGSALGSD